MNRNLKYLWVVMVLAIVLAGCGGGGGAQPEMQSNMLVGELDYGGLAALEHAPLALQKEGGGTQSTKTDNFGRFQFSSLDDANYTLHANTVADSSSWSLSVTNNTVLNESLPLPSDFDRDYFRALSNIRPYISDGSGGIERYGWDIPIQRWRNGITMPVVYTDETFSGCGNDFIDTTKQELQKYGDLLNGAVFFRDKESNEIGRLLVQCADDGDLGFGIIGRASIYTGYGLYFLLPGLDVPEIPRNSINTEIAILQIVKSVATGTDSDRKELIAHELAHVMGLGHVSDVDSLMYPYANGTALELSEKEKLYARILYSIGTGVIIPSEGTAKYPVQLASMSIGGTSFETHANGAHKVNSGASIPKGLFDDLK